MAESNDDLERLARADPVDPASLPSANDRRARALFEEITMTEPSHSTATRPRRTIWIAGAAAALILIVATTVALRARDDSATPGTNTEDVASGAISPGGAKIGSCVEVYDSTTLAKRQVAFDGTVTSVAGDSATFDVNTAYKGVTGSAITLNGASGLSGLTSAGSGTTLEPGTRLLVAGDGGFAWSCGFTQPYDPAVAREWDNVFGR